VKDSSCSQGEGPLWTSRSFEASRWREVEEEEEEEEEI